MTATGRETALNGLQAKISAALATTALDFVLQDRNQELAVTTDIAVDDPAKVVGVLKDGDAAEPDAMLGDPPLWDHVQTAKLEMAAFHPDADKRNAALDTAVQTFATAFNADPTLGGACNLVNPHPPDFSNVGDADAPFGKAAEIDIDLLFTTDSQLG